MEQSRNAKNDIIRSLSIKDVAENSTAVSEPELCDGMGRSITQWKTFINFHRKRCKNRCSLLSSKCFKESKR